MQSGLRQIIKAGIMRGAGIRKEHYQPGTTLEPNKEVVYVKPNMDEVMADALSYILTIFLVIILCALFGQYLWNNVARKLVKGLEPADWYDMILLNVLLALILPA